jgi:hypothetical protein
MPIENTFEQGRYSEPIHPRSLDRPNNTSVIESLFMMANR